MAKLHRGMRVIALAIIVAMSASGASIAAPGTEPPLRLVAAPGTVTLERWMDGWVPLDLGVHAVAGDSPLEFRVARAAYNRPIVVDRIGPGGSRTRLPAGLAADFTGFRDFSRLTLTDRSGAVVLERSLTFCPNSDTSRARPGAPDRSPYPYWCSYNPFTLGGVWGVQAGWSASLSDGSAAGALPAEVPDGDYTATVSVKEPYRSLFGMTDSGATARVNLRVTTLDNLAMSRMTAAQHAAHHGAKPAYGPDKTAGPGAERLAGTKTLPAPARAPRGTATAAPGPRPDLRSLPAWGIRTADGDTLAFSATVWNGGDSPLVVDGFRRAGQDLLDAHQYFYDEAGKQVGSAPAGTMEWDAREGHEHWHFTDFALYRLVDAGTQEATRSGKEAFCLANTDEIDYTIPGARWQTINTSLATACGTQTAQAVRQVLDVGSGDTYDQFLPGQSFDLTGLPNGAYYIEVIANPERRLQESDETNNVSRRRVILGGEPGARTVRVPAHQGVEG